MKRISSIACCAIALAAWLGGAAVSDALAQKPPSKTETPKARAEKPEPAGKKKAPKKKSAEAEPSAQRPRVKMETTYGEFIIELLPEAAPATVANFLRYVREDYYDGTIFYRVENRESRKKIQGGGVTPKMEKKSEGLHPRIKSEWTPAGPKNEKWTIAMVRFDRRPDSAQTEFYINLSDNPEFDRPVWGGAGYTVFGKVVDGRETLEKVLTTELHTHPKYAAGGSVVPVKPVVIKSAQVLGVDAGKKPDSKPADADKPEAGGNAGADDEEKGASKKEKGASKKEAGGEKDKR